MTRKHYVMMAEAMNRAYRVPVDPESSMAKGVVLAANLLADVLASDNPRFDRERFLTACGVPNA